MPNLINPEHLNIIVNAYIECALWADKTEGTNPRVSKAFIRRARIECELFALRCDDNGGLFTLAKNRYGYASEHEGIKAFGQDFWLTRNGHGSGFWDRQQLDANDLGARISALCGHGTQFGVVDVYQHANYFLADMDAKRQYVVFRKWRGTGNVIAFFCGSSRDCNPGNVMSYEHTGQHGEADIRVMRNMTTIATREEYAPLWRELRGIYRAHDDALIVPVSKFFK